MLFSGAYLLWKDPLVVSCLHGAEMRTLLRIPQSADIVLHPTWLQTIRSLPGLALYNLQAKRAGKRVHFMACAEQSHRLLRRVGFPGDLVSISAYVNEGVFKITGEGKEYDAVYAARMIAYKRLHLASKVGNLFVQTYGEHKTPSGEYDLWGFEPSIRPCGFNKGWVSQADIVAIYNRAKVGLALSRLEGAMLASVEYMLCGLPLVTTKSRGGREQFFDDRYVRVVDAAPEAVAEGVRAFVSEGLDPTFIRSETLKKLAVHRARLADYVISIIEQRGRKAPERHEMMSHLFGAEQGIRSLYVPSKRYHEHNWI